jgi:hypothetical protein
MDLSEILVSQYHASLDMLRQAIDQCPEAMWNAAEDKNPFWRVAYHALYFTHEYAVDSAAEFTPWAKHRGMHDFDEPPAGEPYDKATVLEYLDFCRQLVAERMPQKDFMAMEDHPEPVMTKLELQLYNIRHIMQHVGELLERLGSRMGAEIDWVGWVHAQAEE